MASLSWDDLLIFANIQQNLYEMLSKQSYVEVLKEDIRVLEQQIEQNLNESEYLSMVYEDVR